MKPREECEKLAKVANVSWWHVTGYLLDQSEFELSKVSENVALFTNKEDESRELTYIVTFSFFGMLTLCRKLRYFNSRSKAGFLFDKPLYL